MKNSIPLYFLFSSALLLSSRAWPDTDFVIGGAPDQYMTSPNQQVLDAQLRDFQKNGVTRRKILEASALVHGSHVSGLLFNAGGLEPVFTNGIAARAVESVSASSAPYQCPEGYARYSGADSPFPGGVGPGICSQEAYNPHTHAKVVSFLGVNPDGTPVLFGSLPGSKPIWGEIVQKVYYEDGRMETVQNNFYATANDLAAAKAAVESHDGIVTFAGPAPDTKSGFQLQYTLPDLRYGFSYPAIVDQGVNLTPDEKTAIETFLKRVPANHRDGLQRIVFHSSSEGPKDAAGIPSPSQIDVYVYAGPTRTASIRIGLSAGIGARLYNTLSQKYKTEWENIGYPDTTGHAAGMFGFFYNQWYQPFTEAIDQQRATGDLLLAAWLNGGDFKGVKGILFTASQFYNPQTGNFLSYTAGNGMIKPLTIVRTDTRLRLGDVEMSLENNEITGYRFVSPTSTFMNLPYNMPNVPLPQILLDTIPKTPPKN